MKPGNHPNTQAYVCHNVSCPAHEAVAAILHTTPAGHASPEVIGCHHCGGIATRRVTSDRPARKQVPLL